MVVVYESRASASLSFCHSYHLRHLVAVLFFGLTLVEVILSNSTSSSFGSILPAFLRGSMRVEQDGLAAAPNRDQTGNRMGNGMSDFENHIGASEVLHTGAQVETPVKTLQEEGNTSNTPKNKDNANNTKDIRKKKPRLILHFGPMKTGTSSLQIHLNNHFGPLLEEDNWHYVRWDEPANRIHIAEENQYAWFNDRPKIVRQLVKELLNYSQPDGGGRNVIFSREQYSEFFSYEPKLYKTLYDDLSGAYDVEIVAGYRIFYDWVSSMWFQSRRYLMDEENAVIVSTGKWLKDDTGEVYTVDPVHKGFYHWWNRDGHDDQRFTGGIVDLASPYFPSVTVFDLADPMGCRTKFLCDLVQSQTSCKESKRMDREPEKKMFNVGHASDLNYVAIAFSAAQKGLVDMDKYSRREIWTAVKEFVTEKGGMGLDSLPLACPENDFYEDILDRSLRLDATYMPELYSGRAGSAREQYLRDRFKEKVDEKSYCLADGDTIMEQDTWKQFFEQYA